MTRSLDRSSLACVLFLIVIQSALVSLTFPVSEVLSDTPLLYIDNAAHWYRITFALNVSQDGLTAGYDPFFNAGTVAGAVSNPAAKLPAALSIAVGDAFTPAVIWKVFVFSASVLAALCVPLAMAIFRTSWSEILIGGVFAILLWWVSVFRWYHTAGMVSFVLGAYLALPYVALVYRYLCGRGGWMSLVLLGVFGAIGMICHPLFPLPVAIWTVLCLLFLRQEIQWPRAIVLVVVVPAISLLPNLFWLIEVFIAEPRTMRIGGVSHQSYVGLDRLWMELLGLWREQAQGSKMYPTLAIAAFTSIFLLRYSNQRRLVMVFLVTGLFWILYSGLGASAEILAILTQPNRFTPVGYLFLIVPASLGISAAWRIAQGAVETRLLRWPAAACLAALSVLVAINFNELRREISADPIGHYGSVPPRITPIGPTTRFALDWISTETDQSARILFETSRGRIHDGSHIAGYLAYKTQREFIGGHYIDSYFADFTDGDLFGRHITDFSSEELWDYFDLYNIGWIIAFSDSAKMHLEKMTGVTRLASDGTIVAYRLQRPHSYFFGGYGSVESRSHNRLVLNDLDGETIILKYHYMWGLQAEPPLRIEPIYLGDDPNPFIKLIDPPERVELAVR